MQKLLEDSITFNFSVLVEHHTFYQRLRPKMQTEFINFLFKNFLNKFDHFFQGLERGFVNELVINLQSRTFLPGEDIIKAGSHLTEMFFITRG